MEGVEDDQPASKRGKYSSTEHKDISGNKPASCKDFSLLRDQIPCRTLQTLTQHSGEVLFVKFSQNGKYLASSSRDCVVIIWEVQATRELSVKYRLSDFQKPVFCIWWSPDDGQFLTSGHLGQHIGLWDLLSGELSRKYGKTGLVIVSCGWHPDGKSIFTSFTNHTVSWWDLEGVELRLLEGQRNTANAYIEMTRNKSEIRITRDKNKIVLHKWDITDATPM